MITAAELYELEDRLNDVVERAEEATDRLSFTDRQVES